MMRIAIGSVVALVVAGLVLSRKGGHAGVEYDFRTLPAPLRAQAWDVYHYGNANDRHLMHEELALLGYDAAARHFR